MWKNLFLSLLFSLDLLVRLTLPEFALAAEAQNNKTAMFGWGFFTQDILSASPEQAFQVFFPLVLKPGCDRDYGTLDLSSSSNSIRVGQPVTVSVTLRNYGCLALGEPQYRLSISTSSAQQVLSPASPEPVSHSLAVAPGSADQAEFVLKGAGVGEAELSGSVSFEVHLGYPGPAYWGGYSATPISVIVNPP